MLTDQAVSILKMLVDLTGGTEKRITYVPGKSAFCLWDDSSITRDFSEYDSEIDSIMEMLADAGAIKPIMNHVFRLTQIGLHYRELQKLECREKWKERIYGFISGVLVTVIGGVIVHLLTG